MKEALYIIVDVSGSMNEMGKVHLQRNLCRFVAQLRGIDQDKYADIDIRFFKWAQEIAEITIQSDRDIPALNAEGSSDLYVLSEFLSQHLNGAGRVRILILSDGNFPNSDISSFQKQVSSRPDLITRVVAVGADADMLRLKKISTNNSVHLSENISSAIDSAIFGSDEPFTAPVSTAQILQPEPPETEEPEEDWGA